MTKPEGSQNHLPGAPRRADPRHTLSREVRLLCTGWEGFRTLRTINISRGGMLVLVSDPPEVSSPVRVRLRLAERRELALKGRVVRVRTPAPGGEMAQLGVAFDLDPEQQKNLDRFLARTLGDVRKSLPELRNEALQASSVAEPQAATSFLAKIQLKRVMVSAQSSLQGLVAQAAEPIIGIDFGTSSCSVGVVDGDKIRLIRDKTGHASIPSVVWFRDADHTVVGHEAREQMPLDPVRTIPAIKRLLGCHDLDRHVVKFLMSIACPGHTYPGRGLVFSVYGEELTPVEITAIILRHMREMAEKALGTSISKAVLAFPSGYKANQRDDLEQAASLAELKPVAMIPEPIAAAQACEIREGEIVGIYDFGGGSFCFSVVERSRGVVEIRGMAEDPWLGGDDMDLALARASAEEVWRVAQVDLRQRVVEWRRVMQAAEEAKHVLSAIDQFQLYVPRAAVASQGVIDLCVPLTRGRFNEITGDLLHCTWRICQRALAEAGVEKDGLSRVILAGGTSKVPAVRSGAQELFGRELQASAYPDRAVVIGATLKAAELMGHDTSALTLPAFISEHVASQTIGLAMAGGVIEPLIPKNTPLPVFIKRVFATFRDDQTRLQVRIVSGDPADAWVVGDIQVTDLPPGPAGLAEVEVTFEMNDADMLSVRTRKLSTGQHAWIHFQLDQERVGSE